MLPFRRPSPLLRRPDERTKKEKTDKCEIVIKKEKDGTIRKSIRGTCSKAQLEALSQKHTDIESEDY